MAEGPWLLSDERPGEWRLSAKGREWGRGWTARRCCLENYEIKRKDSGHSQKNLQIRKVRMIGIGIYGMGISTDEFPGRTLNL